MILNTAFDFAARASRGRARRRGVGEEGVTIVAKVAERSEVEDLSVLSDEFESAPASEVVSWAADKFGG